MTNFKEPTILKKAKRLVSSNGLNVVEISQIQYNIDDNKYPKLRIMTWKQNRDEFPTTQPKIVNLPIDLQEDIARAILSFKE